MVGREGERARGGGGGSEGRVEQGGKGGSEEEGGERGRVEGVGGVQEHRRRGRADDGGVGVLAERQGQEVRGVGEVEGRLDELEGRARTLVEQTAEATAGFWDGSHGSGPRVAKASHRSLVSLEGPVRSTG